MIRLILKKQLKELVASKSNLIFLGIILVACGIVAPLFSDAVYAVLSIMFTLSFIAQMAPAIFVEEKDSRSLETLVTLPVNMKQIIYGKVMGSFLTSILLFWTSLGLGFLVSYIRYGKTIFTWEQILLLLILIPLTFWAFSWQCTYTSLKSKDTGVCALTLTFVSILYAIPPLFLFVFLMARIDTVVHWHFLSFHVDVIRVTIAYILVLMVPFVLLRLLLGKYFDKSKLFDLLRN